MEEAPPAERTRVQRSLSDSEMDPHLPHSSPSSRSLVVQSSSLSEGGPSSRLWLLLSQPVPDDVAVVVRYEGGEAKAEEVERHETLLICTIPALALDADTPVTLQLSSGTSSTTVPFLYKPLRPSRPSSSACTPHTALFEFATSSDPLVLIQPLAAHIPTKDDDGNNCLHVAARNAQNYALKLLLSALQKNDRDIARDTVNARNVRGETPLHLAVRSNDADAVHYLLSAQAQITLADRFDNSVLHDLAESHNDAIYKEVLERPLDRSHFEAKNKEGLAPLHLAVRRLKLALIESLVDVCPETVDLRDERGRTALLHAIDMNDHEIVAFLLAKGADANAEDESGMNALLLSHKTANMVIMGQLLDAGAEAGRETKSGASLAAIEDDQVQRTILGERVPQVFKGEDSEGIERRRPQLFGQPENDGLDDESGEDDVAGPSSSSTSGRPPRRSRGTLSYGKDDVSALDYLTRLRLSKVLDPNEKWVTLARELDCEHMVELISICAVDSSPTMILLDQFEQLPNASITRVREALVRLGDEESVKLMDDRMVY